LPHFPIYADLLPEAAVSVISQTHEETVPALRLLQQEGFRITDLIDVFDAGPKVNAPVDDIRTVQEARFARVGSVVSEMDRILVEGTRSDEPVFLMSNGKLENFRSCMGYLDVDGDTITLSRSYATLLNVKAGDVMWFSPLIPHSFLRRFERWYSKVPILSGDAGPKAKGRRSVR
jgi:arginine N-succinyltransferase